MGRTVGIAQSQRGPDRHGVTTYDRFFRGDGIKWGGDANISPHPCNASLIQYSPPRLQVIYPSHLTTARARQQHRQQDEQMAVTGRQVMAVDGV